MEVCGLDRGAARRAIEAAGGSVKLAIVMAKRGVGKAEAERLLADAGGFVRRAVAIHPRQANVTTALAVRRHVGHVARGVSTALVRLKDDPSTRSSSAFTAGSPSLQFGPARRRARAPATRRASERPWPMAAASAPRTASRATVAAARPGHFELAFMRVASLRSICPRAGPRGAGRPAGTHELRWSGSS